MRAELNKKTMLWKFGDSDFIYKTEQEANEKGRKELAVKLKDTFKDGSKVSDNK